MDIKEYAQILNGTSYGNEITKELANTAVNDRVVIVYGASDDLMEFEGAIYDEIDCFDGGTASLNSDGLIENKCDDDRCPYFIEDKKKSSQIKAVWDSDGYAWIYETAIPHETFDIMNSDDKYCRGIVFRLADVVKA